MTLDAEVPPRMTSGPRTPAFTGTGRRRLLHAAALSGPALLTGAAGCTAGDVADASRSGAASAAPLATGEPVPFRAARQPGIAGHVQAYAAFVAFDLVADADADTVRRLLRVWSDDIERLMGGRAPLTDQEPELAAHPAGLTVTVGVGPAIPALVGAPAPRWLAPLPAYSIDKLEDRWSGGDLILQVCADSPVTLAHAQRRLSVDVADLAAVRWVQRGFREPLPVAENRVGMRNLFGQVDGSINPDVSGADAGVVWPDHPAVPWLKDGTSMVIRRVAMDLATWDKVGRLDRENSIGRRLTDGTPLTGGAETDTPDFDAVTALGFPVIDDGAHVRRARPVQPHERFLRRPYSYDDSGPDGVEAGLIFVAFQGDPLRQFDPVQRRLAEVDLLNIWTTPIGSAVFAILPGIGTEEYLGKALLG